MIVHQSHNSLGNYSYNAFIYDDCEWFYHFHKNYELIYILEGAVELTLGGRKLLLEADTFALILPNELHAYRTPVRSRAWVGVFSGDFVGEFSKIIEGKRATDPRFTCQGTVKQYLLDRLVTEEPQDLLFMKSLLYGVCGVFLEKVELTEVWAERDFVWDVTHYVSTHFHEELTFTRLAEEIGYEYHYLSRQFHRYFGMNFRRFVNMYRVDFARERLLYSRDSITEIAYSAGFQNVRTFNRVFTEHTGMSPSSFRRTSPRLRHQRQNSDGSFYYSEDPGNVLTF